MSAPPFHTPHFHLGNNASGIKGVEEETKVWHLHNLVVKTSCVDDGTMVAKYPSIWLSYHDEYV